MRYLAIFLLVFTMGLAAQETPETLREQGLAAMKAAQSDPDQIVVAAKFLALAADAFTTAGKEADAEEMNSCLFWAKKKMTIQQIDAYIAKGNGTAKATVAKLEAVEKKEVKKEDAAQWLAKADGYAEAAKDPFLAAVRYFEVASRFKGTPEGEQALEKSLKFLQQAKVAVAPSGKPIGPAARGDGKVYVQSNPVGASILVEAEDGLRDTGVKTPGMVSLPKGAVKLVLRKERYVESKLTVTAGDAIVKTDVVILEVPKFDVDIIAEGFDGFMVCVDGKPVMDKTGKQAIVPCTVRLPSGNSMLGLVKEGFQDVVQRVIVKETTMEPIIVKGKAVVGKSVMANSAIEFCLGKWKGTGGTFAFTKNGNEYTLKQLDAVGQSNASVVINGKVIFQWKSKEVIIIEQSGSDLMMRIWYTGATAGFKGVEPNDSPNTKFLLKKVAASD